MNTYVDIVRVMYFGSVLKTKPNKRYFFVIGWKKNIY